MFLTIGKIWEQQLFILGEILVLLVEVEEEPTYLI